MRYLKYEFTEVPDLSDVQGAIVIVGKLVEQEGTYDEEGNVITAPVISDKIAVDILYSEEPLSELEPFRVTPNNPKHTIAGQSHLYEKI